MRRLVVHSPERERHERKLREAQHEGAGEAGAIGGTLAAGDSRARRNGSARPGSSGWRRTASDGREAGGGQGRGGADRGRGGADLARNNGQRYYDWRLGASGQLEYFENANCAAEKRREGHWLLETEEANLSAVEAVRAYQDLWRVEAAFRAMKDVLELRPVWHQVEERVRARTGGGAGAGLRPILQRKLERAGLELLSSRAAWAALEAVSLVEFGCRAGRPRRACA